jgi:hypothetical protein
MPQPFSLSVVDSGVVARHAVGRMIIHRLGQARPPDIPCSDSTANDKLGGYLAITFHR